MSDSYKDAGSKQRVWLSALVDGDLGPAELSSVMQSWKDDAATRSTWHAYQMIGDTMRSDDLATDPARDELFLRRLRVAMAAEPIVLALPLQRDLASDWVTADSVRAAGSTVGRSSNGGWVRRAWHRPLAVAAGFVAVAGVAVMMRGGDPGASGEGSVASAGSAVRAQAGVVVPVSNPGPAASFAGVVPTSDGRLLRDAQLDRYLLAHRQFTLGGQLGTPAGFVRNVELTTPER